MEQNNQNDNNTRSTGGGVQVMRTGLKNTNGNVAATKDTNCSGNDVRQVYDYKYTPKPKTVPKQTEKRRTIIVVKNRGAGKTPRDAAIFPPVSRQVNTDDRDEEEKNIPYDETSRNESPDRGEAEQESGGLFDVAEKAFLQLGEFVGEGAISASKNIGDLMKK